MKDDLNQHLQRYEEQLEIDNSRWERVIKAQEANTAAITSLAASTEGLVDTWEAGAGVVKAMRVLGQIGKWTASMGLLVYAMNLFKDKAL